ncbi:MAG: protein adenylyltransferase SelO [Spongiibacteraceae bacterium]
MNSLSNLAFQNRFSALNSAFYTRQPAVGLNSPKMVSTNPLMAQKLGIDLQDLRSDTGLAWLSGNVQLVGSEPLAQIYSGHQFGSYNPQLGDGRGLLIGDLDGVDGQHWELHLKGAGTTPYSRSGDGRAVLRSSIREYLGSEAVAGLGIPSTRALALTSSDTPVYREQREYGATLLRVAKSHIRFGHFEFFHYSKQPERLRELANYVLALHLPALANTRDCYYQLLLHSVTRTAEMIAAWQAYGFAHGVMNTDNMSILGDTFDYGPFAFLDEFDPGLICNHSDYEGRYAFNRQPSIGLWNLNALANALSGLIGDADAIRDALQQYEPTLLGRFNDLIRQRLGLAASKDGDDELINELYGLMQANRCDHTLFFRRLSDSHQDSVRTTLRDSMVDRAQFDQWFAKYLQRLCLEATDNEQRAINMKAVNPKYTVRNYLLQEAIEKAEQGDYSEVETLLTLAQSPFDEHPNFERYATEAPDWGKGMEISCSS